jgi:hypothetical protein
MTHDTLLLRHLDANGKVIHAFTKKADHSVQIVTA